jgi:hypothetical protein
MHGFAHAAQRGRCGMEPVDLALCLAIDVSASVNYEEFSLMVGGFAAAFRAPDIRRAALAGPRGAIAVSALFWSEAVDVAVPWLRIAAEGQAETFAEALENAPRLPRAGATALGEGLAAALVLLGRLPGDAARQVVDVSGDGWLNRGRPVEPLRALAAAAGVTVNGLAVLNEEPDLLERFREGLIVGPGAFAIACADYADFAEAIRAKLLRELRGEAAIARLTLPGARGAAPR